MPKKKGGKRLTGRIPMISLIVWWVEGAYATEHDMIMEAAVYAGTVLAWVMAQRALAWWARAGTN